MSCFASATLNMATGPLRPLERFSIALHGLLSIHAGERLSAIVKRGESVRRAKSKDCGVWKCFSRACSTDSPVKSRKLVSPISRAILNMVRSTVPR